jgi:hypothetical protein
MAVDHTELTKLEGEMVKAENTGNWDNVANLMNQERAGNMAFREKDQADTVKAAADYCKKQGFPEMTINLGTDGHVQSIKDNKNSSFLHQVGVQEDAGGSYHGNDK